MSTPHAPDAISYPTIVIGDEEYKIRIDISDVIALQKQGVDILRGANLDIPGPGGTYPSFLERTYRIIAQGIHATTVIDEKNPETGEVVKKRVPMTWDIISEKLGYEGIGTAAKATALAIKKVAAQIDGGKAPATDQPQQPVIQ